jgi:hypothetical protein
VTLTKMLYKFVGISTKIVRCRTYLNKGHASNSTSSFFVCSLPSLSLTFVNNIQSMIDHQCRVLLGIIRVRVKAT